MLNDDDDDVGDTGNVFFWATQIVSAVKNATAASSMDKVALLRERFPNFLLKMILCQTFSCGNILRRRRIELIARIVWLMFQYHFVGM